MVEPGDPEIIEIINTDNNTSLNLTVYKIPNAQNTTLIDPKTEFNNLRYVRTIQCNATSTQDLFNRNHFITF